jgi:uncharacterized protein YydD (DUF2326 family)
MMAVNKLIIDYGHIMTTGWTSIMYIVRKTNHLRSLQVIVETFLDKVSDDIANVIQCVNQVERTVADTNQKYLCLTMIWAIADYAGKNKQPDNLKQIYSMLLVPDLMFTLETEARYSSFYILAEILVHNCTEKSS